MLSGVAGLLAPSAKHAHADVTCPLRSRSKERWNYSRLEQIWQKTVRTSLNPCGAVSDRVPEGPFQFSETFRLIRERVALMFAT